NRLHVLVIRRRSVPETRRYHGAAARAWRLPVGPRPDARVAARIPARGNARSARRDRSRRHRCAAGRDRRSDLRGRIPRAGGGRCRPFHGGGVAQRDHVEADSPSSAHFRSRQAVANEGAGRTEEEMGDLLFSIANLARKLGIEPESALRKANEKFTTRFGALEEHLHTQGRSVHEATLDEMEGAWKTIKSATAH